MGFQKQAEEFFVAYDQYCRNDESIYKSASTAVKYAHDDKYDQAIEQLREFAKKDDYQYWILVFIELDPMIKKLRTHPEYVTVIKEIEDRFWLNQEKLRKSLEEKNLL